jgi:hypothetical protein
MTSRRFLLGFLFSVLSISALQAKDQPVQVIVWPTAGLPVLRVTLGRFRELGSPGSQRTYVVDTTAEHLDRNQVERILLVERNNPGR